MRQFLRLSVIVIALLLALPIAPDARAQGQPACFPETGQCIEGRFRSYWEQNGSLSVFGYPITAARPELNRDTGQTYSTQWFERNRFEMHPENAAPYDVLLGRLGDDRLRQLGRNWQAEPRESGPKPGCLWFDQTGHNVCDQGNRLGFKTYWQTHGLTDPRLDAFGRSLALFGLPLTEPRRETNASGDTVETQWFERARFEWHPGKPDQFKVLLGLLGGEVRQPGGGPPTQPPPAPSAEYTALGDSIAVGIFTPQGYVPRYRESLQAEAGLRVNLTNLGQIGWTSAQLLNALRSLPNFRDAVARSQIVTWNIGANDFWDARLKYKDRTCGGPDNRDCMRSTAAAFKANWDAIMSEILSLRATNNTILRTMDGYNPFVKEDKAADSWPNDGGINDFDAFKPFFDDANSYIRTTAAAKNIPAAPVYQAFNGPNGDQDPEDKGYIAFDGLHPNEAGHRVIADLLRGLGYAPLK